MDYVTREVNQLPGIGEVKFQIRTKEAAVQFDPGQVSEEEVRAAITRANEVMAAREGPESQAADTIL